MSSRVLSYTGTRVWPESMTLSTTSSHGVSSWIMCMSVRGVMMCDTTASPSSMTPSIISRASSSSRPSRWPSLTIVRISSSIDSSSACLRRAAGEAVQQRVDSAGTSTRAAAQAAQHVPQRPGVIQKLAPRRSGRSTRAATPWRRSAGSESRRQGRQTTTSRWLDLLTQKYCQPQTPPQTRARSAAAMASISTPRATRS